MSRKVLIVSQDVDGCIFSTGKDSHPPDIRYWNQDLIFFIVRTAKEIGSTHVVFVNGSARQTEHIDRFNMNSDPKNKTLSVFAGIEVIRAAVAEMIPEMDVSLAAVTLADALLGVDVGLGFAQVKNHLPGAYRKSKYQQVYLATHYIAKQHTSLDPKAEFFTMHVDDKMKILNELAQNAVDFPRGKFLGVSYPQYDENENFVSRRLMVCEKKCFREIDDDPFSTVKDAIMQELKEDAQAVVEALAALSLSAPSFP